MNLMRRIVDVRPGEVRAMYWACGYFFFVLSSYYIIRPIRDAMGVAGGVRNVSWLFTGTLLAMLIAQPLFALVVKRYPARRFIPITYHFFAANLVLFFVLLRVLPASQDVWIGRVFFIWSAVFNLFVVSVFWAFMVDVFKTEQSKRLFGFIGLGGTVGGITGGLITSGLAESLGPENLLLVSALLLEVAVIFVMLISRSYLVTAPALPLRQDRGDAPTETTTDSKIGGNVWAGIGHVLKSPYLLGICMYMLLYTITSTFLYINQLRIAETHFPDRAAQTRFFANVDVLINVLTLVVQAFLTHRIIKMLGVGMTLAILPLISVLGFGGIGLMPTLVMVVGLNVLRRAGNFAVARPTREILYTVLPREDKYKAKSFIDTFVYRAGDQVGAWSERLIGVLGFGIAGVAFVSVPLSLAWLGIALWLGQRQKEMQQDGAGAASTASQAEPAAV